MTAGGELCGAVQLALRALVQFGVRLRALADAHARGEVGGIVGLILFEPLAGALQLPHGHWTLEAFLAKDKLCMRCGGRSSLVALTGCCSSSSSLPGLGATSTKRREPLPPTAAGQKEGS